MPGNAYDIDRIHRIMSMTPASLMTCFLTKGVMPQLERMDKLHYGEQKVDEIFTHALAGAAAGPAAAIPGSSILLIGSVGSLWSMYCRIGNAMRIKRSKAVLKSLTSAFIANVSNSAINIAAVIAAATAISFIPVPGTVSANLIMA